MKNKFNEKTNDYFWFPLDNLAKIYPSNTSSRLTTLFRLTAIMTAPIKISFLQNAFNNLLNRCLYFKVQLKRGFFWYYFQSNPVIPQIMADSKYPCMNMRFKRNGVLPLRVIAFKNRISVEFSHILTDGTGGLSFLKGLVAEYLHLCGVKINDWGDLIRINEKPDKKEWEDSFREFYKKAIPSPENFNKAFHIPYKFIEKNKYYVITGIISTSTIIKKVKEKNVSLTEFLVALYFDVIQDIYFQINVKKKNRNPIRISIPVNLRQLYPSKTMKNFFLTVSPEIDPRLGKFSFDEILQHVYHFMRVENNKKKFNQQIKRNIGGEIHPVLRTLPLFIKNIGLSFIYNFKGENQVTTNLSNMGKVNLPDCLAKHVIGFDMYPPPNPKYKISCTVISYKDRFSITFGKLINESYIERLFFTKLVKMGISVKIETNKE